MLQSYSLLGIWRTRYPAGNILKPERSVCWNTFYQVTKIYSTPLRKHLLKRKKILDYFCLEWI